MACLTLVPGGDRHRPGKKIIIALIGANKSDVPLDLTDEQWVDLNAGAHEYKRLALGLKLAGLDHRLSSFSPDAALIPGLRI